MFQFQNTIQHMDLSARSHTLVHRIKMRQPLKHSQFGMDMNILIMPILVKSTLTLDRHLIIPLMFYVTVQIAVSNYSTLHMCIVYIKCRNLYITIQNDATLMIASVCMLGL